MKYLLCGVVFILAGVGEHLSAPGFGVLFGFLATRFCDFLWKAMK